MKINVSLILVLLFISASCQAESPPIQKNVGRLSQAVTKSKCDSLLAKQLAERVDFSKSLASLKSELFVNLEIEELRADVAQKQSAISAWENSLVEVNAKLKDCQEVGIALRAEPKGAKSLGASEYADILDRSACISHEEAILLYELFFEKYPSGSVYRKAQSRINFHKQQIVVKKNRANASPLRIWQSRFQASRLAASTQARTGLETQTGRKPDSAKRGFSSEFKEVTYVWRDYISDFSNGFRDLIVETVDDKITKVYAGETVRK